MTDQSGLPSDNPEPVKVHRFNPPNDFPVGIDYISRRRNPFKLLEKVTYRNGPVYLELPAGFVCDATSTPFVVWLIPGTLELFLAASWWLGAPSTMIAALFALSVVLSFAMPYLMPAVGQLGRHARATFVHDGLYRTQEGSRGVADAVCREIMEIDGVRWLPRQLIYFLLRLFGWRAWNKNTAILAGQERKQTPGPEPESQLVPMSPLPASPAVQQVSKVL